MRYLLIRKKGQPDQLVEDEAHVGKGWKIVERDVVLPRVHSTRTRLPSGRQVWKVDKAKAKREAEATEARGMTREELVGRIRALEARVEELAALVSDKVGK